KRQPLDPVEAVPALIAQLPPLTHLSTGPDNIQASVVKILRADMLPASLRHLSIFDCPSSHTWSAGAMPRLESLEVNVPMRFKAKDFPALRSLSILPDKPGKLLDEALQMPLAAKAMWDFTCSSNCAVGELRAKASPV
ncbi:hypothetical protein KAF81_33425, partial [Pseudomonas aeruginosa]|uniref:hypothetical protein n=1 Tax=Pseudomonas aeruginosa TaxID=287 RepID=UPI001B37EC5E